MYREACDVDETMYQEFVEAATVTVPVDKATYWDGWDIYSTVRSYANEGKRSWTLEYSLVGYLINNLIFCGQEDPPGIRFDSCPTIEECGFAKGSANAFWAMASTYFGKQAKGQVRVFLNSNREGGAFQINESYFAQYELVNMPAAEVDTVNIYLVTDLEKQFGDNCSSPSIESFRDILNSRRLNYQCFDQPRDVLHLLCVDGNGSSDCMLKQDVQHTRPTEVAPQTTDSARSLHERRWSWSLFLASTAFAVCIPFPRFS
ncbi:ADP-ribosyl cyclase/cyclic ADP-ribose hydrolase-like [Diadema setosum]|uniref:ADP-ribosyl cyclase/cyclic ADP-ribose hydrolase-like n=1 Tax=Diadema setosum TaxID=31175 RepID=UPI003B3B450B